MILAGSAAAQAVAAADDINVQLSAIAISPNGATNTGTFSVDTRQLVLLGLFPAPITFTQTGQIQKLRAVALLSDGSAYDVTAPGSFFTTYSVDATSVATVDSNGNLTAINFGTATVTASLLGITASAPVTVSMLIGNSISVSPSGFTLTNTGAQQQLRSVLALPGGINSDEVGN